MNITLQGCLAIGMHANSDSARERMSHPNDVQRRGSVAMHLVTVPSEGTSATSKELAEWLERNGTDAIDPAPAADSDATSRVQPDVTLAALPALTRAQSSARRMAPTRPPLKTTRAADYAEPNGGQMRSKLAQLNGFAGRHGSLWTESDAQDSWAGSEGIVGRHDSGKHMFDRTVNTQMGSSEDGAFVGRRGDERPSVGHENCNLLVCSHACVHTCTHVCVCALVRAQMHGRCGAA